MARTKSNGRKVDDPYLDHPSPKIEKVEKTKQLMSKIFNLY